MNPFDYAKSFTDFWSAQGQAWMQAQDQVARALTGGMQAVASGSTLPVGGGAPVDLSSAAAEMARASQAMMELWSAASAMSTQLAPKLPSTGGDATVEAVLAKVVDPRQWLSGVGEMDDALGRMAEGPRFADLWQIERRYAGVLQAWMLVRRRALEHNAVVLRAWLQAGRAFMEESTGRTSVDGKAALAAWTETANKHLLAAQRSEEFLTSQREMIRASTALRMAQQELVEHFGKQYGFPTRTELDDVHRTVTELRREIRAMRREQRRPAVAKLALQDGA